MFGADQKRGSFLWGIFAITLTVIASPIAVADILYGFGTPGLIAENLQLNIKMGTTQTVPVYLTFRGPDATLIGNEKGLFSADVHVFLAHSSSGGPVHVGAAGDVVPNPAFDDPSGALLSFTNQTDIDLFQSVSPSATTGVTGISDAQGSINVLLGQITFRPGSTVGENSVFSARDLAGFDDTVSFANHLVFDSAISEATLSFNVTSDGGIAVPLPSGLISGGALSLSIVGLARRKRIS